MSDWIEIMPVKLSNLATLPLLVNLCMDNRHALAERSL